MISVDRVPALPVKLTNPTRLAPPDSGNTAPLTVTVTVCLAPAAMVPLAGDTLIPLCEVVDDDHVAVPLPVLDSCICFDDEPWILPRASVPGLPSTPGDAPATVAEPKTVVVVAVGSNGVVLAGDEVAGALTTTGGFAPCDHRATKRTIPAPMTAATNAASANTRDRVKPEAGGAVDARSAETRPREISV